MEKIVYRDINISPKDAWQILSEDENSCLIDVRTEGEWNIVGYPDLASIGKNVIKISWRLYPMMTINDKFIQTLDPYLKEYNKFLFICKTGGRSLDAAYNIIQYGYSDCYNIIHGFEGEADKNNNLGFGWKAEGLPWRQI